MSESSPLSLTNEIECPVCMLTFEDPVVLPCGHSFCRTCAKGLIQGETLACPSCRQNHSLSPDDLQTNFQLRHIIDKFETGGTLKQAPAPVASPSTAPAPLTAAPSDEKFCESCFFPIYMFDPMHAECKKVSLQVGNRLIQQQEDAVVCSESQPKILGDRVCESNEENMKKLQATIRRLQAEVNKAADEMIDLVNERRGFLNAKIEENYSADIQRLEMHSEEIRKKIQTFEVFAPDRSENLVMRISKLKAAEAALNEFQLPDLEPLEAELLEFERNVAIVKNFSFGKLLAPQPTAEDLPVFHSPVCSRGQFFLHPVPAGFPVSKKFRQVAERAIRLSELKNVGWVRIDWKVGSLSSASWPEQVQQEQVREQLEVDGRQVELNFGGQSSWSNQLECVVGDFVFCRVESPGWWTSVCGSELEKLVAKFNSETR